MLKRFYAYDCSVNRQLAYYIVPHPGPLPEGEGDNISAIHTCILTRQGYKSAFFRPVRLALIRHEEGCLDGTLALRETNLQKIKHDIFVDFIPSKSV